MTIKDSFQAEREENLFRKLTKTNHTGKRDGKTTKQQEDREKKDAFKMLYWKIAGLDIGIPCDTPAGPRLLGI
jgi:hypothetical protein